MNTNRNLRYTIRLALAAYATTAGAPLVLAQNAPAPAAAPTQVAAASSLDEVVVTGSRVQAPNTVSISPVTSLTSAEIEQTGLVRVEDLLNSLPQVVAENSSGQSISSNGTATVSLRGLGSERTLVLVDGRRMNPGAGIGTSSAADINQIPADLIERVDVLTGGASAVYGADAVAGVVNFVMNTHFEGVRVDGNYGFNNHSNNNSADLGYLSAFGAPTPPGTVNTGQNRDISFLMGSNFADGKGNATVYATYLNSSAASGYQFDHAGCTLVVNATTGPASCGGSGTSAHGQIIGVGIVKGATTLLYDNALTGAHGFAPYNAAVDDYNYGALSYFQRPAERYTAGAFMHYDVNDNAQLYSETMFSRNTNHAFYGPSGSFFYTPLISCGGNAAGIDPLLSASQAATLCSPANVAANRAFIGANFPNTVLPAGYISPYVARRSVETGPRQDNYTSQSIREVIGVKGKFADAWTYDAYAQLGISSVADYEGGFLGVPQMLNALNVVTNPNTGKPTCASVLNGSDLKCVPWNIWSPGGVTQAQLNYLTVPASYSTKGQEWIASASTTGDLGKYGVQLPTAKSGMILNLGAEYREEIYNFDPDYIWENGYAGGGNGISPPTSGEFHVWEAFTEFSLPLVDDKPGIQNLGFEGGYRYSNYSTGINTNTFKLGLEWAPIKDVRVRGSYNRAVRAPNIEELYAGQSVGAGGSTDLCWGPKPSYTAAQCALTGVTASQYGNILVNQAAQINTLTGGNANLKPETADTYTFGVVVQPQAIPNLIVSLDYYNIKIANTITELSSTTVQADCMTIDQSLCHYIQRAAGGSLWLAQTGYVSTQYLNIGEVKTSGADLTSSYRLPLGDMGKLNFTLTGSYLHDFTTQPDPNAGSYDCAGYFGTTCGAPLPKWRHVFVADWATPWHGLNLMAKWRYIGAVNVDYSSSNPQLAGSYNTEYSHYSAYNYLDVSASMPIAAGVSFRLGINNVADKDPPIAPNGALSTCPNTSCNDNTWVGTYDSLGRYIYGHITVQF